MAWWGIYILFAVCFVHIAIALFVYFQNHKDRTNIYFGGFAATMVLWLLANQYSNDMTLSHDLALTFNKAVFIFPALTIMFLYLFSVRFSRAHINKHLNRFAVGFALFVALISGTPLVVAGIKPANAIYEIEFGVLSALFFIYVIVFFLSSIWVLFRGYRRKRGAERIRLQFVLLSLAFGLATSIITNAVLPVMNIYALSALGPLSTIIISAGFAYAIIKHRLFNVRLVVARSIAYVLLLAVLASTYGLSVFTLSQAFFADSGTSGAQNATYTILAVIVAFTFQPLKRFFERLTDNIFFRDHYDSQEVLNQLGGILVSEFQLEKIMSRSLAKICSSLKVNNGQLYVFNEGRIYRVEHYGPLPGKLMTVPHLEELRRNMAVTDELSGGKEKEVLEEHQQRLAMKLKTKGETVGFLLLGDKLSGDIYTDQDIEVLEIFGQALAVAIQNAKAVEEIAHFNATLQQKVDDATHKLREANIHLKELDTAKDEFISMASHQLRTPLTSIKGYLSMMLEGDAGKLPPQQQEFVEFAYGGAQRMVNLISDLLNVSRMSAGKFMIEKSDVDLDRLVAEEVQQLQQHADAKSLKLNYVKPKRKIPIIKLDEGKTRQVVMNFVDNAIYYTKQGGVTVGLELVGDSVELRVKDTGIGVPPDAQKKLFTKFYRAGNAQTVRPDGTGLGLFMAKRVIEDQGGTIIFETAEGKGSTFGFSIPVKEKSDGAHKRPPRIRAAAAKTE